MGFLLNFFKQKFPEKRPGNRRQHDSSISGEKTPEKNDFAKHGKAHANADGHVVIDIGTILPQVPAKCIRPDLPAGLKKELRISIPELLPSLALGKATVPFSRIANLSPEIFTEHQPAEPLEIRLPLQQIVDQTGELPMQPGQSYEKLPPLEGNFSNLVVEKNAALPAPSTTAKEEPPAEFAPEQETKTAAPPEPPADDEKISLRLSALLPHIPKALLQADSKPFDKTARIPFLFRLIEPQFGTGKVELPAAEFFRALPDELKNLFIEPADHDDKTKIPIPLAEIILNLPGTTPLPPVEPHIASAEPEAETVVEATDAFVEEKSPQPELQSVDEAAVKQEPAQEPENAAEIPLPEPEQKVGDIVETPPQTVPEHETEAVPLVKQTVMVETQQFQFDEKPAAPEPVPAQPAAPEFVIETGATPAQPALATIQPPLPQLRHLAPLSVVASHQEPASPPSAFVQPLPEAPSTPENPFFSNGKLDVVKIAEHVVKFDNITAVALEIAGEFRTAGDVPQNLNAQDVCTAARTLLQSVEASGAAGKTRHLTLQHDAFSSTFFRQGDILIGVMHPHNPLSWETHGRLATFTEEVARLR